MVIRGKQFVYQVGPGIRKSRVVNGVLSLQEDRLVRPFLMWMVDDLRLEGIALYTVVFVHRSTV
jgi:hypothetical protein